MKLSTKEQFMSLGMHWGSAYRNVAKAAQVFGGAWVFDTAEVSGEAAVLGTVQVCGEAELPGAATIFGKGDK